MLFHHDNTHIGADGGNRLAERIRQQFNNSRTGARSIASSVGESLTQLARTISFNGKSSQYVAPPPGALLTTDVSLMVPNDRLADCSCTRSFVEPRNAIVAESNRAQKFHFGDLGILNEYTQELHDDFYRTC